MKKQKKILLVAIGILILSAICTMMVFANSTALQDDAQVKSISVSTGGNVKINFIYAGFGAAEEIVAEIYAPGQTSPTETLAYDVSALSKNTVTVPLSPGQMNYTVKVYAKNGQAKGASTSYSVVNYAQFILSSSAHAAYHNDMRALLNWGAMAQMYFSDVDSSEINGGYYSRGTNPVNDAITFFEGEGAVNDGALIDIVGWQLFLDPGQTTMRVYFDYAGEGTLSTFVQKEGKTPVKVQYEWDEQYELYCVNIDNVGAAVYNKNYTVTITDSNGDTASITKSVLEYLNRIAFSSEYTDKQQNLARSMYQFYTHAENTVVECDHTSGLYSAYAAGSNEEMICSTCMVPLKTFPSEIDYYSNISHTTTRDVASDTTQRAQNLYEDGFVFARSTPVNGGLTETTLSLGNNVKVGRYIFIKYRVSDKATGDMKITVQSGKDTSNVYTNTIPLKSVQTNGWRIASVNIERHEFRTDHANAADLKISIQHYDTLDIAWVVMEEAQDNSSIRNAFIESGESYYYCNTFFNQIGHGQRRDENGNAISDIELVKTVGAKETTYKYVCTFCNGDICGFKDGHERTFPNSVFNADITAITSGGTKEIKSENGLAYTHVKTNGNSVTTTITANNVPAGAAMFMKYRLANGSTPTGSFRVQVEFNGRVVSNGTVENPDLAKRHVGWIVGRINAKTAVEEICSQGTIINSVTITIIHSDDLDIAYFFTDPDTTEKNLNVFPQMERDGDIYYLHQSTVFGSYAINQWRQITNASTGATSKPGASETASNLWPNPYNVTADCTYGHTIEFDAGYSATCTEAGRTNGTHCGVCGETIIAQETIPTRVHVAGEVKTENMTGGSCLEGGSYDVVTYCAACNGVMSRTTVTTEPSDHTPVTDAAVAPTCTQTGLTEGSHCKICNTVLEAQNVIPALDHVAGSYVVENRVEPGCTTEGSYYNVIYCTRCNEELYRDYITIDALGHKSGSITQENTIEATCYQQGTYDEVVYCAVCSEEISRIQKTIPKTEHANVSEYNDNCHFNKCSVCSEITGKEEHYGWVQTVSTSGSNKIYSYKCAGCDGVWGTKTFSSSAVFNADITGITSDGSASIAVANGMIYKHVAAKGDGQKTTTTFTATNVPIGIPLFMKYRINNGATPTGSLVVKVSYKVNGTSHSVHYGNTTATDLAKRHCGWVVGRVNVKSALNNKGLTAGSIADSITVTIEHYDDLDIAYFVTDYLENNSNVFPQMKADGDVYYMHQATQFGSYASNQWRKINDDLVSTTHINDSDLVHPAYPDGSAAPYVDPVSGHIITLTKTSTSGNVVYKYTCSCVQCNDKVLSTKTFPATVYNADFVSDLTTSGTKTVLVDKNGMLYTHVATDGQIRETTITANNIPAGGAMFMKYRLANGVTPTGSFRVQVEYEGKVVSNGEVTATNMANRHIGWVIGRINVKSALTSNSFSQGQTVGSIKITIRHSDDLDIAFFYTDPDINEKNVNVFPQMYADGDIYYMHQSLQFGSYASNQWRKINADLKSATTIQDNTLKHPSRPDGTDIPNEESAPDMTEDFEEVKDTEAAPYKPKVNYGTTLTGVENADLLKSAANINMFDSGSPIRIDYIYHFTSNKTIEYTITDYYGNPITRIYIEGIAGDSKKISVGFMNHPTGYFTIAVDGVALDYYVVTPKVNERTLTDSPFAMDAAMAQHLGDDLDLIDSYSAAMRLAGVTWVRERFVWGYYQTGNNNGTYTYSTSYLTGLESKFQVIKNRGLNVLMTFSTAPHWALQLAYDNGGENITVGSNKPNYLGTYGIQLAVYEAAKRAATQLGQEVDVIELMNEPDLSAFLDLAEHYASWFKSAALGVVDAGTGMKISMAGLCNAATDFTPILLNSGVLDYASVFNYHTHIYDYDYASSSKVTDLGTSQSVRDFSVMLDLYGVNTPVWISESGMKLPSTSPTADQKKIQTPYIVSSAVQSLSYGVDKYFWFLATNYTEVNNGVAGDFGSFSNDNKPYPTVAAYSVMTNVLGKAEYIGELKDLPNEKARGYLFKTGNGDETVAVVWMAEGSATYTFSTTGSVKVTDLMGGETTKNTIGGQIAVTLGLDPIYITYTTPPTDYFEQSFDKAEPTVPVLDEADHVVITPEFVDNVFSTDTRDYGHYITTGTQIKVRVVNHNSTAVSGSVNVSIPGFTVSGLDQTVTVAAHSEGFITLTLTKNGSTNVDDIVTFTGTFNGKACSPVAVSVYSGDQVDRGVSRSFQFTTNTWISASNLSSVKMYVDGFDVADKNDIVILVNGEEFNGSFTYKSQWVTFNGDFRKAYVLTIDFSSLGDGKHAVSIGFKTDGGDIRIIPLNIRRNGDQVLFANVR